MRVPVFAWLLVAAACAREPPLPVEPAPDHAGDLRSRWLQKPVIRPYVYDHFQQADLVSAANSRYGTVELNLAAKPDVAARAAGEAGTYLERASRAADAAGHRSMAEYERRAAKLLVEATTAARAGDVPRALETLGAARRALDLAIDQVNSTLAPSATASSM